MYSLICRYLGDEEDDDGGKESRSKVLLEKLQKQAKEREQQSQANKTDEACLSGIDTNKSNEDYTEEKKVKRKRKKNEGNEELSPKSKVKKSNENASQLKPETGMLFVDRLRQINLCCIGNQVMVKIIWITENLPEYTR